MITNLERRELFARYYAIDAIFNQLEKAKTDSRSRERARAHIAERTIRGFIEDGRVLYDECGTSTRENS